MCLSYSIQLIRKAISITILYLFIPINIANLYSIKDLSKPHAHLPQTINSTSVIYINENHIGIHLTLLQYILSLYFFEEIFSILVYYEWI